MHTKIYFVFKSLKESFIFPPYQSPSVKTFHIRIKPEPMAKVVELCPSPINGISSSFYDVTLVSRNKSTSVVFRIQPAHK